MPFNFNLGDPYGYTVPGSLPPFTDTTGRTEVSPTLAAERTFIAIIPGQSLASNHIPAAYTMVSNKVHCVNWAGDRKLYRHKEPCFGGSFFEADHIPANNWSFPYTSLWGKVGDLLISGNVFDRVIWLNISTGGAQVATFAPGGGQAQWVRTAFHVLGSLGYRGNQVSAVLSMFGESDGQAGTTADSYKASMRSMARVTRSYGFSGPWFIPLETFRAPSTTSSTIRQAQADLALEPGFVAGPDFDTLGASYRDANGTHQNEAGRDAMVTMWADCIGAYFT